MKPDPLGSASESQEAVHLFQPMLRTFLHYFAFLGTTPTQQDLDYWRIHLTTLSDQMRRTFLDQVGSG